MSVPPSEVVAEVVFDVALDVGSGVELAVDDVPGAALGVDILVLGGVTPVEPGDCPESSEEHPPAAKTIPQKM